MKKISVIISAAALLLGVVSCDKEKTGNAALEGNGKLTINFGFDGVGDETRYTQSTNKPATTWSGNVKSLTLYLVESGTIEVALNIPADKLTGTDNATKVFTFGSVPAGVYTAYLIANYNQTANISSSFSGTSTGMPVASMLMNLVEDAAFPADPVTETGADAYKEPAEIFLATRPVTITANDDNTAPLFELTRAISLMRVRINKDWDFEVINNSGQTVTESNGDIDFTAAGAALRVRKSGITVSYNGTVTPATASADNLIYSAGYQANAVPTGYESSSPIFIAGEKQSAWKDTRILPGGGASDSGNRFDIVISGQAPAGYYAKGKTTGLAAAGLVHWSGTVNSVVAANEILELNVELKTPGSTTVPEVTETGDLEINVDLVPWGAIKSLDLPM